MEDLQTNATTYCEAATIWTLWWKGGIAGHVPVDWPCVRKGPHDPERQGDLILGQYWDLPVVRRKNSARNEERATAGDIEASTTIQGIRLNGQVKREMDFDRWSNGKAVIRNS